MLSVSLEFVPGFKVVRFLLYVLSYCVSFTFLVSLCDVRYDFSIKLIPGSSLPSSSCLSYLHHLCVFVYSGVQHSILSCGCD